MEILSGSNYQHLQNIEQMSMHGMDVPDLELFGVPSYHHHPPKKTTFPPHPTNNINWLLFKHVSHSYGEKIC